MRIESSNVLLSSQHFAVKEQNTSKSIKVWIGNRRPDFENAAVRFMVHGKDTADLSLLAKSASHDTGKGRATSQAGDRGDCIDTDPVSWLVRILTELITGKKIKITSSAPQDDGIDLDKAAELKQAINETNAQAQLQAPPRSGFGLEYDARETYAEAENMDFSAHGMIRTADGKQIQFNLKLSMERAFMSEKGVSIRLGDAVRQTDPLMINFDGSAAQLTATKFSFDINADGSAEQVSFAGINNGFIALDKNNDGTINDGSELFGAMSGNGFQDLFGYDQDKNGWIDESDAVFSQLKVWSKDSQGKDSLSGLKSRGVGALYRGTTTAPFELKTSSNSSLGTIRSSGLYLKENGSAGTLQQVDLTL
ncbi:MAG TPA: VCBS repeat-containing protein [Desulfuromonadales bacterium]|nr:VCBS repeat-containing protein [Desulfuromonadales bacterium]